MTFCALSSAKGMDINMKKENILSEIRKKKIIAIVRGIDSEKMVLLADALYAGGIRLMEITFDQSREDNILETSKSIKAVVKKYGKEMLVGAGTVLSKEQVDAAYNSGATFILSPSVNVEVIRYASEKGMVTMPGAMTPSEIETAYEAGGDIIKIFPVVDLGSGYIKNIKAPLSQIPFSAVGGVNLDNMQEYFDAGCVCVGIGGNLVNKQTISEGKFEEITLLASEYSERAK